MGAPSGNRFWEARSSHGRKPIFESAEALLQACMEYFQWVEDNPLYKTQAFAYEGNVELEEIPLIRAMTQGGLCLFLDIAYETWRAWGINNDFSEVVAAVNAAIREQKFAGAAAGLLNANIIARDLGLRDAKDVDHSSSDGTMSPGAAPLTKEEAQELLDNNK